MSELDDVTVLSARHSRASFVREAGPADYQEIRDVVTAAYRQYADLVPPDVFSPYLADVLDLEQHARHGQLRVVEVDERVRGFAAFYPDASLQGFHWPRGWATGRALAVHPAARGLGVARTLLAAGERLARQAGASVFAFHTSSFMTGAIALYERLGYCRAPEFDFDLAARYSRFATVSIRSMGYLRYLDGTAAHRCALTTSTPHTCQARLSGTEEQPMTTSTIVPSYDYGASDRPLTNFYLTLWRIR